jgi:hypothetical protein
MEKIVLFFLNHILSIILFLQVISEGWASALKGFMREERR